MISNKYKNIHKSILFNNMNFPPENLGQMYFFIYCHKGVEFLNHVKISTICDFYDINDLQLDTLFILLRVIVNLYKSTKETMIKFIYEKILSLPNLIPEFVKLCEKTKFIKILIDEIFKEITIANDHNYIQNITALQLYQIFDSVVLNLAKKSVFFNPYTISNANLDYRNKLLNYIYSNKALFEKIIDNFHIELLEKTINLIQIGNIILDLCSKKELNIQDTNYLKSFCNMHIKLIPKYNHDKILKKYYELNTQNVNSNNGDLSYFLYKNNNQFSHIHNINIALAKIGYKSITNISYINPSDFFVDYGLVKNKQEFTSLILSTMINEKNTPGFVNKYDTITLTDYFTMICIGNNIDTSYDMFINKMKNEIIPNEFPLEILLRIISRVYNIIVILYTNNLTKVIIDNTLYDDIQIIEMYQSSENLLYHIIPNDVEFRQQLPNKKNKFSTKFVEI